MKRILCTFVLGVATSLVSAAPLASADGGFRCPSGRLVSTGDHMLTVQKKCGEPDFVNRRTEKRKTKVKVRRWTAPDQHEDISEEREIEVIVDEWTYDFGSDRLIRFVAFEDARVVGVTTGGYGAR